jgi:hypothetical protein
MSSDAIFGFAGVLVGSLITAVVTLYRKTLAARREALARHGRLAQERAAQRDAFQRESVLALQAAVTDLIGAAYSELDRMIAASASTGVWQARRWQTPTAVGRSDALLRLETSRTRVFDDDLRRVADALRTTARDSIWADTVETAKDPCRTEVPAFVAGLPLEGYRPYHATRADLLGGLRRDDESRAAYDRAIDRAGNAAETAYLIRRRDQVGRRWQRSAAAAPRTA